MRRLRLPLAFLLGVLALASCATGKGSGFVREASREKAAHPQDPPGQDNSKDQPKDQKPVPTLTIVANPSNARITINGRLAGTGSVSIESSGFGQKADILVEAPSYRSRSLSISLWGQTDTVSVDLEPILGTLQLVGENLSQARLAAGGHPLTPGANRLLIGRYTVVARRFGFEDQNHEVEVIENQTTTLPLDFVPAPFALTRLGNNHPDGFNPDSASIAATTRLTFSASAPGHALLVLTDRAGLEVARWDFPRMSSWDQEAVWNGRYAGKALPDGVYTLTLTGGADQEVAPQTLSVLIDRSLIDTDRPSLGPAPGLLWTPTPEVFSPGTFQVSLLGLGHVEGWLGQFPLSVSVRGAPAAGWEVFGQSSFRVWTDPTLDSGYFTLALKRRIALDSPNFRAAWVAGATLGTWLTGDLGVPPTDFLTTFPAARVLLPAAWSWGKWTLVVTPEVDGSYWSPATAYESASGAEEGFRFWAYGRLGLSYDPGAFSVALSGAARTRSFDRGTGWLAPAHLGLEARYPVAGSPLTLTGYLSVSAYSTVDYAWYGGVGVSLLVPASLALDLGSQVASSP
jgi:hypothetical protein